MKVLAAIAAVVVATCIAGSVACSDASQRHIGAPPPAPPVARPTWTAMHSRALMYGVDSSLSAMLMVKASEAAAAGGTSTPNVNITAPCYGAFASNGAIGVTGTLSPIRDGAPSAFDVTLVFDACELQGDEGHVFTVVGHGVTVQGTVMSSTAADGRL